MNNPLKDFRKRHNFSQRQASEALGYKRDTWIKYEQMLRPIPTHLLKHIYHYERLQEFYQSLNPEVD